MEFPGIVLLFNLHYPEQRLLTSQNNMWGIHGIDPFWDTVKMKKSGILVELNINWLSSEVYGLGFRPSGELATYINFHRLSVISNLLRVVFLVEPIYLIKTRTENYYSTQFPESVKVGVL